MKALGITAMIFAIVTIFVPVVGPYLTLVCAFLAAFSAGPGLTFGVVAILVNILNIAFLSPSLWITSVIADIVGGFFLDMGSTLIGAQIVAAIILIVLHFLWRKRQSTSARS